MVKNTRESLRDEIIIPIIGTKYAEESAQLALREAEVGTAIRLLEEPENPHDPNAIAIYLKARKVGYIGNKGQTCLTCMKTVLAADNDVCPKCKSGENITRGGMATRIKTAGCIKKGYRAWLSENPVTENKPAGLFMIKIILKEPIDSVFVY